MSEREPIFNVPGVVVALLGSFRCGASVRSTCLPEEQAAWLTAALAFIPARLTGLAQELPGGDVAGVTQFVTHLFVHGDLTHLLINSAWLLAFGSSVARRTGGAGFSLFFILCGIAGALVYLAFSRAALSLMVGASGAISGLMGAAFRFLFQALRDGDAEGLAGTTRQPPLMSLGATLRDRRILLAVAGWTRAQHPPGLGRRRAHGRRQISPGRRISADFIWAADLWFLRPVTIRSCMMLRLRNEPLARGPKNGPLFD